MVNKLSEKQWVIVLSIIGSIASIIGLVWVFFPPKPSPVPGQTVKVSGSQGIGVIAGRDVNVNVNPKQSEPAKPKLPAPVPGEIEYRKLASPAFNQQLVGKSVTFRAVFLSEWSLVQGYQLAGVPTENLLFLNHRGLDYAATNSPLGSSDNAFPAFPLSISVSLADAMYGLHKGDFILVRGQVELPRPRGVGANIRYDYAKIYVRATELKKLSGE